MALELYCGLSFLDLVILAMEFNQNLTFREIHNVLVPHGNGIVVFVMLGNNELLFKRNDPLCLSDFSLQLYFLT